MSISWPRRTLDLVFPPLCVFCSTPCESTRCCDRCKALLPLNSVACHHCAAPISASIDADCASCQLQPPEFEAAVAPLLYEFPVDMAIKSLKFRRNLYYLPVFAEMMLVGMQRRFTEVDSLVPVPLHRWRQAFRGFNQALELASIISRKCGVPVVHNISRQHATKTQSGLTAEERKHNLRDAFRVAGKLRVRFPLIIDDVMTTGETCNQVARELSSAGAERVYVLTIARAPPPATG